MPAAPLTARSVEGLLPDTVRREIPDGLLPGLYLIIQPSGSKSWAVRYRIDGRPKKLTVGAFPKMSLAAARQAAREALQQVAEGHDPNPAASPTSSAKSELRRATFTDLVETFLERHVRPRNRPSTAKETERLLRKNVLPAWGNREARAISRGDVIELLDGLADRGAAITANRTLAALSRLFNWAVDRDLLTHSPCDRIAKPGVERSRDRVLSEAELQAVSRAAVQLGWPFGTFVQLLILTGQRRNEVAGMRWLEVDLARGIWTIPAARTKNGRTHEVPLAGEAVSLLEQVPRVSGCDYVFTTNARSPISGFSHVKDRIDQLISHDNGESLPPWTFHDLRRTMASGMARLGTPLPIIEKVLNHVSGSFSGIVGVYQRHDYAEEKREALRLWAQQRLKLWECKLDG